MPPKRKSLADGEPTEPEHMYQDARVNTSGAHGHVLADETGLPPKRKSLAKGGAAGAELMYQRVLTVGIGGHAPALAQEGGLPFRHNAHGGVIYVSRTPVLIAWVAAVAERQGYSRDAGLSFGKAVAAMLALKERQVSACAGKDTALQRQREALANVRLADVFGMQVRAVELRKGDVRAAEGCQAIDAGKVQEYLVRAFDGHLGEAELAFAELAEAYPARQIGAEAYRLFKEFRPSPGQGGAGRMRSGPLRLERLRELAAEAYNRAT